MTISSDRLSVWEIAHRWHDVDPHCYESLADIPLEVKDTLRNLAAEIYYERLYSDLWLDRETNNHKDELKAFRKKGIKKAISDYQTEFNNCIELNDFSPSTFKAIMIPIWELEYWCKEYNIPFPGFWAKSLWQGGERLPFPGSQPVSTEGKEDCSNSVSEQHRMAALARHEPMYDLKRKCVIFHLAHPELTNAEAARRFYKSLPDEEKKLAPTNYERTLSEALSEYKNKKDKLWLEGFNPSPPAQTG